MDFVITKKEVTTTVKPQPVQLQPSSVSLAVSTASCA